MSEGEIILPDEDAQIEWRRYSLRIDFYPSVKLTRIDGLQFAERIVQYLEPDDVQPGLAEWIMSGGGICDGVTLRVGKTSVILDVQNPSNNLEWYEHRFEPILDSFRETFSPEIALHCKVVVNGLVPLSESVDAQAFLGGYVMLMHPNKLKPIQRPLHVLGVRLLFPPYEVEDGDGADWSVDVRVESAVNDEHKLFLEADSDWHSPEQWKDDFVKRSVARLSEVSSFMSDRLVKFLRQPPFPESEEEDHGE